VPGTYGSSREAKHITVHIVYTPVHHEDTNALLLAQHSSERFAFSLFAGYFLYIEDSGYDHRHNAEQDEA
jgi:hypothetical protein